ncbi:SpaH/EbpB family LPXTG-anchored major pilin [uncultured Varibaculum sp.]|uniref:SpaH/EbpB family LPXTG-anchored major pilin n=1 Tax=uncultured Varibaculum sp. TaxID=413896 RepID=UPI0026770632|nr:SpaH/EbpB family LPXTG-anchored major pilin [uncultured Varibaculum sp.]
MFTTSNKLVRKGMALAAALGMSALGLVAIGAPGASAAPAIDSDKDFTISVEPQVGETGVTADGKSGKFEESKKLPSGTFKLEKGDYDVTTTTGYNAATTATVATFKAKNPAEEWTKDLETDGKTSFIVKPGLYRLTQTKAPSGFKAAIPSLILIPMTDPETGNWMNTVTVYPKNGSAGKITKKDITAKDQVVKPGAEMTFEIDSPIPTLTQTGDKFKTYKVTDTPSGPLKVDKANSQIKKVVIVDGADETALEATDYTVIESPYGIQLTSAGLAKLDGKQGKILRVTLTGKVAPKDDAVWTQEANNWSIKNKATYNYESEKGEGGGSETGDKDQPNIPMAKLKVNNKDNQTGINDKGAVFDIYACDSEATGDPSTKGDPVLTGLTAGQVSDEPLAAREGGLCVVQTKAPTGYEKGSSVVKVAFDKDTVKTAADANKAVEVDYQNTLKSSDILSKLPLTGGAGIALFLIVAAGLLGGAYYYARRNRVRA